MSDCLGRVFLFLITGTFCVLIWVINTLSKSEQEVKKHLTAYIKLQDDLIAELKAQCKAQEQEQQKSHSVQQKEEEREKQKSWDLILEI